MNQLAQTLETQVTSALPNTLPAQKSPQSESTRVKRVEGQLREQRPLFSGMAYHNGMNVVDAAKARIRWCLDNYDDLVVSFSGGKDSLVLLELTDIVYKERGRTDKVKFKFMDEELVCDSIIDFMKSHCESGRWEYQYYALQMYVGFFVMGRHEKFISWDPARKWHRQPPPYAILDVGYDTRDFNENQIGLVMHPDTSRTVCELVGVRAQESMKRKSSITRGGRAGQLPNYVSFEALEHVHSAKPIFDMSEADIFKFLHDYNIPYCSCYDAQAWTKAPLRVASAMHERAAGQFFKMKEIEPLFYESLRSLYPEIETHFRYWRDVDQFSIMYSYPHSFDGIRQYIDEHIEASHKSEAMKYVQSYETKRRTTLAKDPGIPLGYAPVLQVFKQIIGGKFVKGMAQRLDASPADVAFEEGDQ